MLYSTARRQLLTVQAFVSRLCFLPTVAHCFVPQLLRNARSASLRRRLAELSGLEHGSSGPFEFATASFHDTPVHNAKSLVLARLFKILQRHVHPSSARCLLKPLNCTGEPDFEDLDLKSNELQEQRHLLITHDFVPADGFEDFPEGSFFDTQSLVSSKLSNLDLVDSDYGDDFFGSGSDTADDAHEDFFASSGTDEALDDLPGDCSFWPTPPTADGMAHQTTVSEMIHNEARSLLRIDMDSTSDMLDDNKLQVRDYDYKDPGEKIYVEHLEPDSRQRSKTVVASGGWGGSSEARPLSNVKLTAGEEYDFFDFEEGTCSWSFPSEPDFDDQDAFAAVEMLI